MISTAASTPASDETTGTFRLDGLPCGMGTTIGNALRRTLLSALPGAVITDYRIDNVPHRYFALSGMKEDITEFELNLKQVRFRTTTNQPGYAQLNLTGPTIVTAGDLECRGCEVVNTDLYLCELGPGVRLVADFRVEKGVGYQVAPEESTEGANWIPLDRNFGPIKASNFLSEPIIGSVPPRENLYLEVTTDGSLSPESALASAAQLLIEQLTRLTLIEEPDKVADKEPELSEDDYLAMPIDVLELTPRTYNALVRHHITTIGALLEMSDDLRTLRNFGDKSLAEVHEKLAKVVPPQYLERKQD